jgi:hypothetical protein
MPYCRRFDENNQVYLLQDVKGKFCCCGCALIQGLGGRGGLRIAQESSVWMDTRSAAILHLRHHRLAGHKFPASAEQRLMRELRYYGERPTGEPQSFEQYRERLISVIAKLKGNKHGSK